MFSSDDLSPTELQAFSGMRSEFRRLVSLGPECPPSPNPVAWVSSRDTLLQSFKEQIVFLQQLRSSCLWPSDLANLSSSRSNQRRCFELVTREHVVCLLDDECRRQGLPLLWGMPLEMRNIPANWRSLLDYVLPAFIYTWAKNVCPLEVAVQLFISESELFLWEHKTESVIGFKSETVFSHSDDYRNMTFRGVPYVLTTNQAIVVQKLHEALLRGQPEVSADSILGGDLRDAFRKDQQNSVLWGSLIVDGTKKGMKRLHPDIKA